MKSIVADESVDFRIVTELRKLGLNVYSISENKPGIKDSLVLDIAFEKGALLLTEDKDFGELVFRLQLKHHGVLLIRMSKIPSNISAVATAISIHHHEMVGKFSVIDDSKIRIKD